MKRPSRSARLRGAAAIPLLILGLLGAQQLLLALHLVRDHHHWLPGETHHHDRPADLEGGPAIRAHGELEHGGDCNLVGRHQPDQSNVRAFTVSTATAFVAPRTIESAVAPAPPPEPEVDPPPFVPPDRLPQAPRPPPRS